MGCIETIKFIIYDFKKRDEKTGQRIESSVLKAHGCEWKIWCYPRGQRDQAKDHVSCYLNYRGKDPVAMSYSIRCKQPRCANTYTFKSAGQGHGYSKFIPRSIIEKHLEEDGSLVLEVDIQKTIAAQNLLVWYPKQLQRQDFLVDLYQDASSETTDVLFSVGKKEFRAHRSILCLRCKKLYEIAKESKNDEPILISSMREDIFKTILEFAYTVKLPDIENKEIATELLVAADCYDCVHLKLYVESFMVDKLLTPETAAELLVFADSYSCPLLKEKATDIFIRDVATVKKAKAWSQIVESSRLLHELIDALTAHDKIEVKYRPDEKYIDGLDVTALRNELEEKNLELDGSREVLVQRLKTFRREAQK